MRWFPVRVAGSSMEPTLRAGEFLAVRGPRHHEPLVGQIVVVRVSGREIVKRVAQIEQDGTLWLEGDNADASTDSRRFGGVERDSVAGVVALRYWPVCRVRRF